MAEKAGLATAAPAAAPKLAPVAAAPQAQTAVPDEARERAPFERVSLAPPPPPQLRNTLPAAALRPPTLVTPPTFRQLGRIPLATFDDPLETLGATGGSGPRLTARSTTTHAEFRQVQPPSPGPFVDRATSSLLIETEASPLEAAAERASSGVDTGIGFVTSPGARTPISERVADMLQQIEGLGALLPTSVRSAVERRIHATLPEIHLFDDATAWTAAAALEARAFAYGTNLFFAEGEYRPESLAGLALIAHEAVHVAQQRDAGDAWIQRQPKPKDGDPADWTTVAVPSLAKVWWSTNPKLQKHVFFVGDEEWISIANTQPTVPWKVAIKFDAGTIAVLVESEAKLETTVHRVAETGLFDALGLDRAAIRYDFACEGKATFIPTDKKGTELPAEVKKAPYSLYVLEEKGYITELNPTGKYRYDRELKAAQPPESYPSYDTIEKVAQHVKESSEKNFLILQMPDGRYVVRHLNDAQLRDLAAKARQSKFELGPYKDLAHYKGQPSPEGVFVGLYLDKKDYGRLDALTDRYYPSADMAGLGAPGDPAECEVYVMGAGSYGRKPLTHDQAVTRWTELDSKSATDLVKLETEPGFRFHELAVKGASGTLRFIDATYVDARERFFTKMKQLDAQPGASDRSLQQVYGQDLMNAPDLRRFIEIEADREKDNPAVLAALKGHKDLADTVGRSLFGDVEDRAQAIAISVYKGAIGELRAIRDSKQELERFVLAFAGMPPKQQRESLILMGVPETEHEAFEKVLKNPEEATQVLLGNSIVGGPQPTAGVIDVDIPHLLKHVGTQIAALEDFVGKLEQRKILIIHFTDDNGIGNSFRKLTYDALGFKTLKSEDYPHGKSTIGMFPSALEGDRAGFTSILEQMFANQSTAKASQETIVKILAITVRLLIMIGLIAVGHLAGATLARLVFGTEAAATALSLVVTSALLTGADVAEAKLIHGETLSWDQIAKSFGMNVAMGAIFARIGGLVKGVTLGASVGRASLMFGAMLGLSLVTQGVPKDGKEWMFRIYENLAMAVLMEAASIMVIRPAEEQLGIWARAKRLGVLGPEYDALRTDVMRLFADVAATRAAPATAAAKGKGLRTRTKALLTQQKELAKKLGESFRTRPEAAEVETEVKRVIDEIDQRIAAMEDAGLLLELELTPVGDTHGVLSYKPGTDVPAKMKAFFRDPQGAEPTVEEVEPGVYKVEVPSLKMKYLLFPEGTTPPSPLVAELAPKTPLNLNTATTGQIELTFKGEGIGKKLAEEIVKLRQQKGGSFDSIDQLKEVSGIDDTLLGKIKAKAIVAPKQSIDKVQTGLLGRRKAIVEQADFYGIDDPALQIVRALKPKDFQKLTEAELAEVDKKIAVAEKSAGEKIAKARIKEIDDATKRLGAKGIAELRQDQLASMSNEEVADALHEARTPAGKTRPNLGVPELRGILHARRKGVDVRRLLDIGEGKSMVERNWVLSKAGEMFELGILNVDKMLGEMSQTSDKWDGGRFVMEVAYFDCGGINNILAFEFRVQIDSKNYRDVDIVLKTSPRMIEVKEWTVWSSDRADKLADQHIRDVQFSNYDPAVYQNLRIVFRNPTPASIERIRADIRSRLETALDKAAKTGGITRERVRDLLAAFDKKTDLVVMSDARRVGSAPVAPPPGVPIPGKPPGEKKDDNVAPPIPVPGTATP